ncbi:MAG: hypothetical protein LBN00_11520 [Oscillospiraceae bacterium]|jgi:hypothetical protein|nr:hypothetical protein [Oscillospiraceae bacterium]
MPDYKKMYFELAAKVADAIDLLVTAQQNAEEQYISESVLIEFPETTEEE